MDMEDIEAVVAAHLCHLHGQGQRVVGVFEQPVVIDRHRVEKEARSAHRHPERLFVADEVDLVAAPGQFHPQGRGEHAASADGRITSDANLEGFSRHVLWRRDALVAFRPQIRDEGVSRSQDLSWGVVAVKCAGWPAYQKCRAARPSWASEETTSGSLGNRGMAKSTLHRRPFSTARSS